MQTQIFVLTYILHAASDEIALTRKFKVSDLSIVDIREIFFTSV